jgi:hypothetical protein
MHHYIDPLEPRQHFDATSDISPSDRALMRAIAPNEGEYLYVRPDALGNPIIGIGFQLGDPNAKIKLQQYGVAGVSYDALIAKWESIKTAWTDSGRPLENLKTDAANLAKWEAFRRQQGFTNRGDTGHDITYFQSTKLFRKTMAAVVEQDMPAVFGQKYIDHPYDVQTALADMMFDQGRRAVARLTAFVGAVNTKQYGTAAKELLRTTYASRDFARASANAVRFGDAATIGFTTNSFVDFSGLQGHMGWYYGYNTGTDGDFVELSTFEGNWFNQLGVGGFWTQLWPSGGHPNSTVGNGGRQKALQHAVRRFVSPFKGTVEISGAYFTKSARLWVLVDGTRVFDSAGKALSGKFNLQVAVAAGSKIDLVIGPNGDDNGDSSMLKATIARIA